MRVCTCTRDWVVVRARRAVHVRRSPRVVAQRCTSGSSEQRSVSSCIHARCSPTYFQSIVPSYARDNFLKFLQTPGGCFIFWLRISDSGADRLMCFLIFFG